MGSGAQQSFSIASVKEPSPIWMRMRETRDYQETTLSNQVNHISMILRPRESILRVEPYYHVERDRRG